MVLKTCVIFWIKLQILFVPWKGIIHSDDEISHIFADGMLLAMLSKNAGAISKCERAVSRKTKQYTFEKIVVKIIISPKIK